MKAKRFILSLAALLTTLWAPLRAASISVNNVTLNSGGTTQLTVIMANTETNLSGFQFKLELPQGVTIAKNDRNKFIYALSDRIADHTLSITALDGGGYQFICYSMDGDLIAGTSGGLLSVTITADDTFTVSGNGSLKDIRLTDIDANKTICNNVSFQVNIPQVPATSIALNRTSLSFTSANQTEVLTATVTPSNATNKSVTWTSSNTSVATVSNTGVVTAKTNGTAIITATTTDGTNLSATCPVTVAIPVINFADANVKALCVANWDTNGDGELSEAEAAAVTDIGTAFKGNTEITSFNELQYFTGLTQIGTDAFRNCSSLISVDIPSSVTKFGYDVFNGCSSLTSLTIPNSVTRIEEGTFRGCSSLTSMTIHSSVTNIEAFAFHGCTGLTSLDIPSSVTYISNTAFGKCSGLTSISVDPNNSKYDSRNNCNAIIETANNTLLLGCKNTSFPNSVTKIGSYAFYYCSELTTIIIPGTITFIGSRAFSGCSGLTSVFISSSVTSIGNSAFNDCPGLTSVVIENPTPVTISSYVFSNRANATLYVPVGSKAAYETADYWKEFKEIVETGIVSVAGVSLDQTTLSLTQAGQAVTLTATVTPSNATIKSVTWTSSNTSVATVSNTGVVTAKTNGTATISATTTDGTNLSATCTVTVAIPVINFADANVKALCVANWDTNGDGELSEAEATAVTDIGTVFKDNTDITSFNELQYFTGLTQIGDEAFRNCSSLTSVVFPSSVTSIGEYAFAECKALKSITIPSGVTKIARYTFTGCENLVSVSIPNSVTTIGIEAFSGCKNLVSVTIPNSVTYLGIGAFRECSVLTSITIPTSVTSIWQYVFSRCTSLSSITIPSSVTSIRDYAFDGCTSLTSLDIPSSVTYIHPGAFSQCSGLTSISVDSGNSKYDSRNNCNAIIETATNTLLLGCKNTSLPNSVTKIGCRAFYYCSELTTVIIPSTVTIIENAAFDYCSSLTSVTIPTSVTTIGDYAFDHCPELESVTVDMGTPITITAQVFTNRANATLYVPAGCKSAYEQADYWKEFKEIIEMDSENLATSVTLNQETISLTIGESATLTATILPAEAGQEVLWTSSNTNVATVNTNGLVTAVAAGSAIITATTKDGTNLSASCEVTVTPIKATAISLNQTTLTFTAANETATLTATITPSDVADGSVTWTSSNTNVATVSSEGVVTAIANGTATITATTNDGTNLSSTCTVSVNIAVPTEPDTDISALDNVIYINKVEAGAGQEFDLSIKMKNTAAIRGYQFDLYLPDGMSVVEDEDGYPLVNLSTERTRMGRHTVEGIIQSDGALRVLSGAQRDYTYSGNDGEVCTITVHISDEMAEGDYPIIFRNIKLTETDISQTYNTSYLKATLSVSTYTLGDINGDGAIDVADYIGVANAILGMPPTSYVEKAADVNVDGIVDVADYIGVANLILYGNVYGSNGNQVKAFVLTPEDIFIGSVIRK